MRPALVRQIWLSVAAAVVVASCATPYAPTGITGGFDAKELREDVYRVTFSGNGYTSTETAQTYWLYKCADLALEKGYYGFELLSDMHFAMAPAEPDEQTADGRNVLATSHLMPVVVSARERAEASRWRDDTTARDDGETPATRVRIAHGGGTFIYVPTYGGSMAPKPSFEGDIHLLKRPFEAAPPKLFAAAALKTALDGYVNSDKCGLGNVCPHVHEYLLPRGKLLPR